MLDRFTDRSHKVLVFAWEEAKKRRQDTIEPLHLLYGIILEKYGIGNHALLYLKVDLDKLKGLLDSLLPPMHPTSSKDQPNPNKDPLAFGPLAKLALEKAINQAQEWKHGYVGTEHLLLGVLAIEDEKIQKVWKDFHLTAAQVKNEICELMGMRIA